MILIGRFYRSILLTKLEPSSKLTAEFIADKIDR